MVLNEYKKYRVILYISQSPYLVPTQSEFYRMFFKYSSWSAVSFSTYGQAPHATECVHKNIWSPLRFISPHSGYWLVPGENVLKILHRYAKSKRPSYTVFINIVSVAEDVTCNITAVGSFRETIVSLSSHSCMLPSNFLCLSDGTKVDKVTKDASNGCHKCKVRSLLRYQYVMRFIIQALR